MNGESASITSNAGPIGSQHLRPLISLTSSPVDCSGSGQITFLLSNIEDKVSRRVSWVDWRMFMVIGLKESIVQAES